MPVRYLLIPMAIFASCFAQQADKPPCNARNRGTVWPPQNARDACTEVQVCTAHVWWYRWDLVTVHVSRLEKDPKQRSACEGAARSGTTASHAVPPATEGHAAQAEFERGTPNY
jgi:hypothetical protein